MASMEKQFNMLVMPLPAGSTEQEPNSCNAMDVPTPISSVKQEHESPTEEDTFSLLVPQPLNFALDLQLFQRIAEDFKEQIDDVLQRLKALENPHDREHALALAVVPVPGSRGEDRKRGRKPTTELVWEIHFNFEPPEFCMVENIDLEKVLSYPLEEGSNHRNLTPFSATRRMQNWMLERRRRGKGTFDLYYHHFPSKQKFRSKPETIEFLLFGTTRPRPVSNKKPKLIKAAVTDNQASGLASGGSSARGEMPSHLHEIERVNKMLSEEKEIMGKMKMDEQKENKGKMKMDEDMSKVVTVGEIGNEMNVEMDETEKVTSEESDNKMVDEEVENKIFMENVIEIRKLEDEIKREMMNDDIEDSLMIEELLKQ